MAEKLRSSSDSWGDTILKVGGGIALAGFGLHALGVIGPAEVAGCACDTSSLVGGVLAA